MPRIAKFLTILILLTPAGAFAARGAEREYSQEEIKEKSAAIEERTKSVLTRLFPEDEKKIKEKLRVDVFFERTAREASIENSDEGGERHFILNMYHEVPSWLDEGEYAALLAHEWAHIKLLHVPVIDAELHERQEIAADNFALVAIRSAGYGGCVLATMYYKVFKHHDYLRAFNIFYLKTDTKRLLALVEICADNG